MTFSIIAAVARDGAIGITRDGVPGLPWPTLRQDMAFFSGVTQSWDPLAYAQEWCTHGERGVVLQSERPNCLIVGTRTWSTLPLSLAHRRLIVLSRRYKDKLCKGVESCETLVEAIEHASWHQSPHVFVVGGASVYAEALCHPACEQLFLTEIDATYPEADTHWPWRYCGWEQGVFFYKTVTPLASGGLETRFHPAWRRTACSAWITEPERHWYRFTIYERAQS